MTEAASTPVPAPIATSVPRSVPARGGGYDRVGGSRLTGSGAVLLAAIISGALIHPTSADRQVMVVVWAAMVGVFVVGVVVPLVAVRRIGVDASSPRDATVGDDVPVVVNLTGRSAGLEVRALDPTGAWHRAAAPGEGTVGHLADRRGLFSMVRVEVRVTAPLGILAVHKVHEVRLPWAIEVAPRPIPARWLAESAPVEGGTHSADVAALSGDLVRSVRPYVSGDPPHLVHWPSSARLGELVVREFDPPAPRGQAVVVDLTDLGPQTEPAASYALGVCRAVLAAGGELMLATCEASGPVVGRITAPIDAGRRLARAVPGSPALAPVGWPVVEIGR